MMVSNGPLIILFLSFFIVSVFSGCTSLNPPYGVPLSPSSFQESDMSTCCWYASETCCGYKGQLYDLSSIEAQIKDLSDRGLSDNCYLTFTNLLCFWCDKDTTNFLAPPKQEAYNVYATAYLCPSFCDELFFKCFDDITKLVNNPEGIHTTKQFCENIILDNFHSNSSDIFPNVRFVVTNDNYLTCFGGAPQGDILDAEGVCIPSSSGGSGGAPIVFISGSFSSTLVVNLSLIFMFFFIML